MEENSSEWEICKENIQPLKQGRKIDTLKSALCPNDDYKQLQKQTFESALRTHSGDDLLEIWHKYILWVEQNYPSGGKESKLFQLIESCVIAFKDKPQYYNNDKYIEIWIKYANAHSRAIEIFRYMYSHNIGCQHAVFFENWAWSLESMGNFKQADEVLTEGIQRNAQPIDNLIKKQRKFHQNLVNEVKHNLENSSNETSIQESRTALCSLNFDKRNIVSTNRTGTYKSDMPLDVQKCENLLKKNNKKQPFNFYKDENTCPTSLPCQTKNSIKVIPQIEKTKENEMKPKKWTDSKLSQKNTLVKQKRTFEVHVDEESTKITTKKTFVRGNILSNINKSNWIVPLALFEPPDPMKISMYCKSKVYAGSEEFSFEEIEAARRKKLYEEKQEKLRLQMLEEEICHLKTQVQMMKNSSIDKEYHQSLTYDENIDEKTKKDSEVSTSYIKEVSKSNNSIENEGSRGEQNERLVNQDQTNDIKKYSENASKKQCFEEITKKENLSDVLCDNDKCPQNFHNGDNIDSVKLVDCYNPSDSFNSFHVPEPKKIGNDTEKNSINIDGASSTFQRFDTQNGDISTNLTVSLHTKEVTNMIRGVWYKTLTHSGIEENNTESLTNKIEENKPNGNFIFYQDPTEIISSGTVGDQPEIIEKINDEIKENIPPSDYVQEQAERPLSGILQPALDIPVEEQNQSSDDEIGSQSEMDELTLYPPNCTKQFEEKVHIASTPFTGLKTNFSGATNVPSSSFISEPICNNQVITTQSHNILPCYKSNVENKVVVRNGGDLSVIVERSSESYKSSSSSGIEPSANIYSYNSSHHLQSSVSKNVSKSINSEISHSSNKSKSETKSLEKLSDVDPFDKEITDELLSRLNTPVCERSEYIRINKNLPPIKIGSKLTYGPISYIIPEIIAEGAYAKIYLAKKYNKDMTGERENIALKVCRSANEWEFYICTEIHDRLEILNEYPDVRENIMRVEKAIIFNDAMILCNEYGKFGSLLDIINIYKQKNQTMPECLVLYITLEMLYIFQQVHSCKIIHADVKPDNFLIINLKSFSMINYSNLDKLNILKLIDFGRSIDMHLFPPGTTFTKVVDTSGFKCTEMLDGKPWTYQTDWFGVLGSIHVMLFSEYMKLRKNKNGEWEISNKFKRYWQSDFWQSLFHTFLNIPSCNEIPDITPFICQLNKKLKEPTQINAIKNKANQLWDMCLSSL